jgi:heme/copper-type cytochrome/quinol oxidase subunit 4
MFTIAIIGINNNNNKLNHTKRLQYTSRIKKVTIILILSFKQFFRFLWYFLHFS